MRSRESLKEYVDRTFEEWFKMPLQFNEATNKIIYDTAKLCYTKGILNGIEFTEVKDNHSEIKNLIDSIALLTKKE